MQRNPNFHLQKIEDAYYLLPFGQAYADHKSGLQINETGAFLWEQLSTERSLQELCSLCSSKYEVPEDEYGSLCDVVKQYLQSLKLRGLLDVDEPCAATPATLVPVTSADIPLYKTLCIAGITLRLFGPEDAFDRAFDLFTAPDHTTSTVMSVEICLEGPPVLQCGTYLVRHRQLSVIDCSQYYILRFPEMEQLYEAHLCKDGSLVRFYCKDTLDDTFRQSLFHALRLPFLYLAQRKGMVVVHSASILYQGKVWLFSAPSGTGKSTHVNLWKEILNTPIINGDLNLCAPKEQTADAAKPASFVVHGIPWCGTSGICDNKTHPLGGIIFLKQASTCSVEALSPSKKQLHLSNRFITPVWEEKQLVQNLKLAKDLSEQVLICRLHCTPTPDSVTCIREKIDSPVSR